MPRSSHPSYRLHKPSGQAAVRLDGHDFYLGKYGSPESRAEYDRLIALWLANGRRLPQAKPESLSVGDVVARYFEHARVYYRQQDRDTGELVETSQIGRLRYGLGIVTGLFRATPAAEFGPLALKACRQKMIEKGWCRKYINQHVDCVKRMFKWAVSEELLPSSVYEALRTVAGLPQGRTQARETEDVKPVPEEHIPPVRALVLPQVAAMIDLQLLTAARPGEVLTIRPCDVSRDKKVWEYRPAGHKTAFRGHERVIYLGPQAQAVLTPYLLRAAEAYCFSPLEATRQHYERMGWRLGPLNYRDRYRPGSYSRAVRAACKRAGVPPWHPHQLRHNAATRIVAEFGWDVARILLGHKTLAATRIYGEDDVKKAVEAMSKTG